jgi:hypothetical protein
MGILCIIQYVSMCVLAAVCFSYFMSYLNIFHLYILRAVLCYFCTFRRFHINRVVQFNKTICIPAMLFSWKWRHHIPLKCHEPLTKKQSITTQNTWILSEKVHSQLGLSDQCIRTPLSTNPNFLPENKNRASFQNIVFCLEHQTMDRVRKLINPKYNRDHLHNSV